jgi:formate dehydrogenase assembly factor FdhD
MPADLAANTIEVEAPDFDPSLLARNFYTTSSCGACGKGALEAVAVEASRVESANPDDVSQASQFRPLTVDRRTGRKHARLYEGPRNYES